MSAAIILRQSRAIHLMTDAAVYFRDGLIAGFRDKTHVISELHCAVTTLGASQWNDLVVDDLRERFSSFDDMKDNIAPALKELYDQHNDGDGGDLWDAGAVWVVGWSEANDCPDGFTVAMIDPEEYGVNERVTIRPFLVDGMMPGNDWNIHPCPTAQQLFEAFPTVDLLESDAIDPELDLLQMLEVQRRMPFEGGFYAIGGYALLTTVTRDSITQKRVHSWDEDRVGEMIEPTPINWNQWRARRIDPAASVTALAEAKDKRARKMAKRAALVARQQEVADGAR